MLKGALGMSDDDIAHHGLDYSKSFDDALDAVRGPCRRRLLHAATPVEQVQEVAAAGESMPPKSTYFSPKIPTGLVFNPLESPWSRSTRARATTGPPASGTAAAWRSRTRAPRPTGRSTRPAPRSGSAARRPRTTPSSTTTSCASRPSCSSPAPSWPPRPRPPTGSRRASRKVTAEMVERLEHDIDRYMERVDLPPKFVIPGGTELSARLDVARTAVRRAERRVVDLKLAGDLADDDGAALPQPRLATPSVAMARYADEPDPELFEGARMRAVARSATDGSSSTERRESRPARGHGRRARGRRRRRRRARARRSCWPGAWPRARRSRWRCTPSARAGTSAR